MNIYQKMSKATEKIGVVAKNLTVSSKSISYKAVSERDIIDAVKPIEAEYGIYSFPYEREIVESQVLEKQSNYGTITSMFMRLRTVYRFVNMDNPTEYLDITTYGDGVDTQDKAAGKAMTYADKYALMKAYKISTGDDPDQEASQEWESAHPANKPSAKPKVTKPENKPKEEKPMTASPARGKVKLATEKQIDLIKGLYTEAEMATMLGNLKLKDPKELTIEQASKMIETRRKKER